MIQTIKKAWGIPELRKKIIFTALILLIFRIGNAIPVPYVNTDLLSSYLEGMSTTVLGLYNVMSGGAFAQATVFALGVQPYINSSIIIQLLTIAIPALERLARDGGEEGKKKIQSITRYATVAIAILQGWGYYMLMKNYGILTENPSGWLWSLSPPSSPVLPSSCGWASRSQSSVSATVSPSSCLPASCPVSPAWCPPW